ASTVTNGALASVARRRAISVLPTPVGPIIRMFLGITSLRSSSSSWARRQRLRSAIATARLACCWPTMWRSSSCTISRGVMVEELGLGIGDSGFGKAGVVTRASDPAGESAFESRIPNPESLLSELFDNDVAVGIDADVACDPERLGGDGLRVEFGMREQRAGGGQGERAAGADRDQAVLRFDHVAGAADDQRGVLVGHGEQRLELAEAALGAPVLGQLDRGARELAVLLQLRLEQFEQGERIGRRAGEAGQHLAVLAQPAHL